MQLSLPDAISQLAGLPPWQARLHLGFEAQTDAAGTRTVLRRLAQFGPLAVQKPLYPEGRQRCHAILLHPPGGIAGGDELEIALTLGEGAQALLTTPGAGKWYASLGPQARQQITLRLAADSTLEWLPQETILFSGAQAQSHVDIHLAAGARLAWWDMVCFGRPSSDLAFSQGQWRQTLRLFGPDGALQFIERARVLGDDSLLSSPIGLDGQAVMGCMLVTATPGREQLAVLRELPKPATVRLAWTQLDDLLVLRGLAPQAEPLRQAFTTAWQALRPLYLGLPAILPRIWAT